PSCASPFGRSSPLSCSTPFSAPTMPRSRASMAGKLPDCGGFDSDEFAVMAWFPWLRTTETISAIDAAPAAHAVRLAAMATIRHRLCERCGTLVAIRLPNRVGRLALGARQLLGETPALQVCFDLSAREITVVNVLSQVNFDEFEQPALFCRDGVA